MKKIIIIIRAVATLIPTIVFTCFITMNAYGQSKKTSNLRPSVNKNVEEYDTFGYLGKDYALSVINGFKERSKPIYEKYILHKDIPYGLGKRETFDHFHNPAFGKNPEKVFIFIHGGYWQGEVKESYAFVAKKLLERNIDVILIEYDLTRENEKFGEQIPRVSMTAIVNEVGTALDKIQVHLSNTVFNESTSQIPVYLSGHSAGGHLAAMLKDHPLITGSVMPISGIFDLVPISKTKKIGQALQLNMLEASKLSPINNLLPAMDQSAPVFLYYGADEQLELVNQSKKYHKLLQHKKYKTDIKAIPAADHFTVLTDLFEKEDSVFLKDIFNSRLSK